MEYLVYDKESGIGIEPMTKKFAMKVANLHEITIEEVKDRFLKRINEEGILYRIHEERIVVCELGKKIKENIFKTIEEANLILNKKLEINLK